MSASPRVLVQHATPLVRAALFALLNQAGNIRVLDSVCTVEHLLPLAAASQPDVILHGGDCHHSVCVVAERLQVRCPNARLLALLAEEEKLCPPTMIERHFAGALFTTEIDEQIVPRVHLLAEGHTSFSRAVVERLLTDGKTMLPAQAITPLSKREREILTLLRDGLAAKSIATRLRMTQQSVWNAVSRIYHKLGVNSRAEALRAGRDWLY